MWVMALRLAIRWELHCNGLKFFTSDGVPIVSRGAVFHFGASRLTKLNYGNDKRKMWPGLFGVIHKQQNGPGRPVFTTLN